MRSYPLPAADASHHHIGGVPAYPQRFTKVGKFHVPGLAPVEDSSGAYHIHPNGQAAYATRFDSTFGFYENLAAVRLGETWFRIRTNGERAYANDFVWCGNFQETRCPVRNHEGSYWHIEHSGMPVYPDRHLYAGDYRDGVACVRLASGLCTHVDLSGHFIHAARFLDLDVFHKGFARARDTSGWFHVDRLGRAAYDFRFAELEPFYNGQAYALGFNGQRLIVDETGAIRLAISVPKSATVSDASNVRPLLVLIGAPGAGKTTLANALHERTGMRFASIDSDRAIHGDGSTSGEMRAWAAFMGKIEQEACDALEFSGSWPLVCMCNKRSGTWGGHTAWLGFGRLSKFARLGFKRAKQRCLIPFVARHWNKPHANSTPG